MSAYTRYTRAATARTAAMMLKTITASRPPKQRSRLPRRRRQRRGHTRCQAQELHSNCVHAHPPGRRGTTGAQQSSKYPRAGYPRPSSRPLYARGTNTNESLTVEGLAPPSRGARVEHSPDGSRSDGWSYVFCLRHLKRDRRQTVPRRYWDQAAHFPGGARSGGSTLSPMTGRLTLELERSASKSRNPGIRGVSHALKRENPATREPNQTFPTVL